MKRQHLRPPRLSVRVKPGGFLCLPPWFLKRVGWRIGDGVLVRVEDGRLLWTRLPDERSWRIDRLRQRIGSVGDPLRGVPAIRTLGDYRVLSRAKARTGSRSVQHVLPLRAISVQEVK